MCCLLERRQHLRRIVARGDLHGLPGRISHGLAPGGLDFPGLLVTLHVVEVRIRKVHPIHYPHLETAYCTLGLL